MTNYGLMCENTLNKISKSEGKPSLFLHACCAPCASYTLEYLVPFFDITLFFYNPNIAPESEYTFRANELERLIKEHPSFGDVKLIIPEYDSTTFFEIAKGKESLKEGGERCFDCYRLRLEETAKEASGKYDFFCTTLSISPHKNAEKLNLIGGELAKKHGVEYLFSDFKKKGGYQRSIALSREYGLYRQDYCGCIFSKKEAMERRNG
ncbi:MAG: epoxyqueuosine reductase QueH [Clostridia bacterium]|nr:epoxyqueuosine reductase QueH [Clostridia bacterium]